MGKYFDNCNTVQELSRERSRLLAEINSEFNQRNKELKEVSIRTVNVPVFNLAEYKTTKEAITAFNIKEGGKASEIIVDLNESTVII